MQSQFMELIHEHIDRGINSVDGLSEHQKYQLTAAYLKETSRIEQWEYITEPPGCEPLPQLLMDVIEKHQDDSDQGRYAKYMLANTMADAAVRWCYSSIEDAFSRAYVDRYYWDQENEY
jgi:hypothetical protein